MNNHHLYFNKNYEITECAYCGYPSVSTFVTEKYCLKNPERIQFNEAQRIVSKRIADEAVKSMEKKLDRLIIDAAFKDLEADNEAKTSPDCGCYTCHGSGHTSLHCRCEPS